MSSPGKISARQERAILALLTCRTHAEAAEAAKIGPATLTRWLADRDFLAAYRSARRSVVESAIGRLQQAATSAVDALARNLSCGRPTAEVAAAKAILEQSIKAVELVDLLDRVEELEARLAATTTKKGIRL